MAGILTPKQRSETSLADPDDGVLPVLLSEALFRSGETDMEIFQNASDDQIALMGCAAALLFSGGLMYVSYFAGRGRRDSGSQTAIPLESQQESRQDDATRRAA